MTERLRKILKGGKLAPKTADEAAVKYAVDNAGGGGSELPAVTNADNGKVLGVVGGAWDKMEAAKEPLVVEFTATESGGSISVSTTTLVTEILAAKAAGRDVVGTVDLGAYKQEFPLTAYGPGLSGDGLVGFGGVIPDSGDKKSSIFSVQGDADINDGVETDIWQLFVS